MALSVIACCAVAERESPMSADLPPPIAIPGAPIDLQFTFRLDGNKIAVAVTARLYDVSNQHDWGVI
jgi:hypothetical protein